MFQGNVALPKKWDAAKFEKRMDRILASGRKVHEIYATDDFTSFRWRSPRTKFWYTFTVFMTGGKEWTGEMEVAISEPDDSGYVSEALYRLNTRKTHWEFVEYIDPR